MPIVDITSHLILRNYNGCSLPLSHGPLNCGTFWSLRTRCIKHKPGAWMPIDDAGFIATLHAWT